MPELPEVETTKKSLEPLLNQQVYAVDLYQPKLRWQIPEDIHQLKSYRLTKLHRRAKYLILDFEKNTDYPKLVKGQKASGTDFFDASTGLSCTKILKKSLIIHLGMSGSLQQYPKDTNKRKHDHLIMGFTNEYGINSQLHYHDPRRFGAIVWADDENDYRARLLDHLGVEPLGKAFTAEYLYQYIHRLDKQGNKISKRAKPISRAIKSVIMEQKVVVGVGNIYATESLFLSSIHPSTAANLLTFEQLSILVAHIKSVLATAIKKGGSTLKDFTVGGGTTGYFQQTLLLYGNAKQPCPNCKTIIKSVQINGRASAFCPKCQPL